MADNYDDIEKAVDPLMIQESLEDWVMNKCEDWRDNYTSNYEERFEEYYRLWRAIWDPSDKQRDSERSKIINPALQQAVESSVAELEEASFGRGSWFTVSDNVGDKDSQDVQLLRNKLTEDFENTRVRQATGECLLNAAVYGTGIAEICIEEIKEMKPATQPAMGGQLEAFGVEITDRTIVKMRPVQPQNFLIESVATCIEDAVGCAVDEFVSRHYVEELQERGVYREAELGNAPTDTDLEPDDDLTVYQEDKIRLTKYYGLVPRELIEEEVDDLTTKDSSMVEAIVVIANSGILLKVEENPYMMQDRPIVSFAWDTVPGRFWGRGVCEKGYMSQKALDTELRARIDGLALTIHPMIAMDASRMPRGAKPEIRPGKTILTNGNPNEVLRPFNFGALDPNTFNQAAILQQMVQSATGAIDSSGIGGNINGEGTAAGISMSLGAIIKRHKRTLVNFQQGFLIPFVKKAAYRYMQFDPDNYPVKDYKFNATSSLGIIAREYEVGQLTQLLQTMSPDSPLYPALVQSIVENMNLSNREELIATLQQAAQPNPEADEMRRQSEQAALAFQQAQTDAINAQGEESISRANKYNRETELMPLELELKKMDIATDSLQAGEADDKEFERRLKVADRALKEKELQLKISESNHRMSREGSNKEAENKLMEMLQNSTPPNTPPTEGL